MCRDHRSQVPVFWTNRAVRSGSTTAIFALMRDVRDGSDAVLLRALLLQRQPDGLFFG
jgi:hypothetical protein